MRGGERGEDAAHLIVARNRALDLIDTTQVARFGHGLLFEVEQRGSFERKHGEGAFQDNRQDVLRGIASTVIGDALECCAAV